MSTLWQQQRAAHRKTAEPLAARMRPRRLEDFVGQEHILGPGKMLRRMLEADRITSIIFYGPPGTGKTSLAEVIAQHTRRYFVHAHAAGIGVKQIRDILDSALKRLEDDGRRTILFLDEIHRFNRAQQDVLLRDVEGGIISLIGATTENPFFAINSPLVSRSQIFSFEPLNEQEIERVIRCAVSDEQHGLGQLSIQITDQAIAHWASVSDGDARRALTALEIAVLSSSGDAKSQTDGLGTSAVLDSESARYDGECSAPNLESVDIDLAVAEESIQRKAIVYDGTGDDHYDAASALIKAMRGSDPDAATYWLAKMLEAGEDPRFIARRIAILASEDIGNADPRAISVAAAAYDITERIGMPECQLTLAQAAIYMATAPKSNATANAIWSAMQDVKENRTIPVPRHLRDSHYAGAKRLGHGEGYQYAHAAPGGFVDQQYLGVDKTYYQPTDRGYERRISEYLQWIQSQMSGQDQHAQQGEEREKA